ncbi:hypothetical protein EVAR_40190_1 [Eumeta japonica]|uniref:Uncharacterized protein n=1 Tax=Eumeta variegata TaxID=151549 RepID=A0A4C1XNZ1_EUMVA|nr:hypothetical protein EVAR_40190_1 [Eumeta japonica]
MTYQAQRRQLWAMGRAGQRLQRTRLARSVKYHALIEYGGEVAASIVVFCPVSESSRGQFSLLSLHQHCSVSIRHPIPSQEVGHALVTPQRLQLSMGDGDRLLLTARLLVRPSKLLHK